MSVSLTAALLGSEPVSETRFRVGFVSFDFAFSDLLMDTLTGGGNLTTALPADSLSESPPAGDPGVQGP